MPFGPRTIILFMPLALRTPIIVHAFRPYGLKVHAFVPHELRVHAFGPHGRKRVPANASFVYELSLNVFWPSCIS